MKTLIKDALALIVIMTPSAKSSEYVTYEWAFAYGFGVKVIPILLESTLLHPRLEALQYFDFTNRIGRPWEKLVTLLKGISASPTPRLSTRLRDIPIIIQNAVNMLHNTGGDIRKKGILILQESNHPAALESLINGLKHPLSDVRFESTKVLGETKDPAVVPSLIEALRDSDSNVREAAAKALGEIKDPTAVPALIEALRDSDSNVRKAVARAVRKSKNPWASNDDDTH